MISPCNTWCGINFNYFATQKSAITDTYTIAVAIWRQDSAQRRQDAAQRLQWSLSCFSHSLAQRSQASAHTPHI